MKVACPACSASGNIDESTLPKEGRQLTCPRCRHRFKIWPERSGVDIIQQRERMVCPTCKSEQPIADSCTVCGTVVKSYLQSTTLQREQERLEFVKLRSETRGVDAWYRNLFDRRLSTLMLRVLSLLFLVGMFMTCSYNGAKRNKFYAENTAEMKKITEGQTRATSPEKIDSDFRDKFGPVVDLLASNTDACLSQNYNYQTSWYQTGQSHYLTEYMSDNLSTINRRKREVETAFHSLPTPSKKYQECYQKVRGLSNLHQEVCSLANSYSSHYSDFHERLSNFSYEINRTMSELNACKSYLK